MQRSLGCPQAHVECLSRLDASRIHQKQLVLTVQGRMPLLVEPVKRNCEKKNTRFITLECSLQVMRSPWHVELFWMLGTDVIFWGWGAQMENGHGNVPIM